MKGCKYTAILGMRRLSFLTSCARAPFEKGCKCGPGNMLLAALHLLYDMFTLPVRLLSLVYFHNGSVPLRQAFQTGRNGPSEGVSQYSGILSLED